MPCISRPSHEPRAASTDHPFDERELRSAAAAGRAACSGTSSVPRRSALRWRGRTPSRARSSRRTPDADLRRYDTQRRRTSRMETRRAAPARPSRFRTGRSPRSGRRSRTERTQRRCPSSTPRGARSTRASRRRAAPARPSARRLPPKTPVSFSTCASRALLVDEQPRRHCPRQCPPACPAWAATAEAANVGAAPGPGSGDVRERAIDVRRGRATVSRDELT